MSPSGVAADERRTGTRDVIDKLFAERQEMLVLFCRVAGLDPYQTKRPDNNLLRDFCQVLVDYSAFAHFEIYQRIVAGQERREPVIQAAEEVYNHIAETTEIAVTFNDKYDEADHRLDLDHLAEDLSALGEAIAMRIEMEDRIIAALTAR